MEVVKRFWYGRVVPTWLVCADAVGTFTEEAAFRTSLAWAVLRGKSPKPIEKRWWNRATETPVLVNVYDWTDKRLIFSVLVWPPLESAPESADHDMRERTEQVLDAIARGASQRMWSTCWELDYGLRWDHNRECWVDGDGHRYDGSRFGVGSRTGGG
jgi:hypothetical protein